LSFQEYPYNLVMRHEALIIPNITMRQFGACGASPKAEMSAMAKLAAFDRQKYLSLETYRKNGEAVRTPVWFAAAPGPTLYVYTTADSGKVKRLRRTGEVRIAPCNARGTVTGAWSNAGATIVDNDAFVVGMRFLDQKYRPWKQIMDLAHRLFPRHRRVMIAIRPSPCGSETDGKPR
jgi:PPOX class probable F420-dependent enzyme